MSLTDEFSLYCLIRQFQEFVHQRLQTAAGYYRYVAVVTEVYRYVIIADNVRNVYSKMNKTLLLTDLFSMLLRAIFIVCSYFNTVLSNVLRRQYGSVIGL